MRSSLGRIVRGALLLAVAMSRGAGAEEPSPAAPRRDVFLNGVNINGVAGQSMKSVDIEIDPHGNVHIRSEVYKAQVVSTPPAAAPVPSAGSPVSPVRTPAGTPAVIGPPPPIAPLSSSATPPRGAPPPAPPPSAPAAAATATSPAPGLAETADFLARTLPEASTFTFKNTYKDGQGWKTETEYDVGITSVTLAGCVLRVRATLAVGGKDVWEEPELFEYYLDKTDPAGLKTLRAQETSLLGDSAQNDEVVDPPVWVVTGAESGSTQHVLLFTDKESATRVQRALERGAELCRGKASR